MTTIVINGSPANMDKPNVLYDNYFGTAYLQDPTGGTAGFPRENAATESTYDGWVGTGAAPYRMVADMGTARTANCLGIASHNLTSGATAVRIQYSSDNITYTNACSLTTFTDDGVIMMFWEDVSARYWRLQVETVACFIGVVRLGNRTWLSSGIKPPYTPVWMSRQYELLTSMSMGGHFLGNRVVRQAGSTTINLVSITETKAEGAEMEAFRNHYNEGKAFFFAAGPSVFPKDCGYLWRKENSLLNPTFDDNGNYLSMTMDVYSYADP